MIDSCIALTASAAHPASSDPTTPIRGKLFSTERLEQFAGALAAEHTIHPAKRRGRPLLPRLAENGRVLLESYRTIAAAGRDESPNSPAAQWLVDNFHIVEEQLREIREDLPPAFYRELPKLASGPLEGYPRVYSLAWAFVEHTDSRFDPEMLRRFVQAYQRVQPLTIGELWAAAISLRLVLVENLRRLVEPVVKRRIARGQADALADALLAAGGRPRRDASTIRRELEQSPLSSAFAVQLLQRLREQDPAVTPALDWLHERLAAQGVNPDELVRLEHQRQVATHVTVRNVITSMRLLSSVDWTEFFESVSLVEELLRDGTRVAEMDFPTRDRYRRAVEDLSRGTRFSELEIARRAVQRARSAGLPAPTAAPFDPRLADPGYYLISRGRADFEKDLGYRLPVRQWLRRAWFRSATLGYIGTIALFTAVILSLPVTIAALHGTLLTAILLLALFALVPASDLAVAVINREVTRIVGPRRLPKLELKDGVPREMRTLLVVPALLTTEAEVNEQIEQLEVHYLGNPDGDVRFALLSDWTDADTESAPGDEAVLAAAIEGTAALNARHGPAPGEGNRFLLFHRRRVWNEREGVWMGWERKRGKLHELNRLLRGATDTTFLPQNRGPAAAPDGVVYVVTLDADTRLPRDGVRRLVGTMAHPLNRPSFDPESRRVVKGYAVIQPRVMPTLPVVGWGTLYQQIFSGPRGIDPYAFAVSDVYQDLFGEGIYTGKGIYDVDAFETALEGRVPENALLSHDLFEGLFARAGLASDIEIFEGYPGHYEVAASRQQRWARGDWQLLPWLLPRVPDASGRRVPNRIPAVGLWKMIDNLRRTLSAPAALATLVAGWVLPTADSTLWTAFILGTVALPGLYSLLARPIPVRRDLAKRSVARGAGKELAQFLLQTVLRLILLAHQAWLMADAIGRTLFRLLFTHRHMLEWVAAAQAHRSLDLRIRGFYRRMRGAVWVASGAGLLVAAVRPGAWPEACGFVAAWVLSPFVARWVSLPPGELAKQQLSEADAKLLRRVARRTWRYFETFVLAGDNHLPLDNFQEVPRPVVAHRTSPTNVGLALLSTVAARDFGWIGLEEMVDRLEATIASAQRLERFRGHFYNWYDTQTLGALEPRYISTVDSGNLYGDLVVVRQACLEHIGELPLSQPDIAGIADAVAILREAAAGLTTGRPDAAVSHRQLEQAIVEVEGLLAPVPASLQQWASRLAELSRRAATLVDVAEALSQDRGDAASRNVLDWSAAVRSTVASHLRDLDVAALRELQSLDAAADPVERAAVESAISDLDRAAQADSRLTRRLAALARICARMLEEMDFTFLFDPERKLFSIGYRLSDGRLDRGYYDLLASEARLSSFLAIARSDVPASHWFRLGRQLTPVGRGSALISWSGSMFEYLMPDLLLDEPSGSLLGQTSRLVVERQIRYGQERHVPWGISESAFNARDLDLTYQYSNFGVSGLGLKRGLAEDLVVAPYATALAAMIEPAAAARNFERLAALGASGPYGFYESLDYTASRLPEGEKVAIVRAYMAHHQGMTIVALANVLAQGIMRARFHRDPAVQATELLLQERTPSTVAVTRSRADVRAQLHVREFVPPVLRRFRSPQDSPPRTHLLSNGRYCVMVTAAGSGYSRWADRDVTRWSEDVTRDDRGSYAYLRDAQTGRVWSAGYQPTGAQADAYEAIYSEDRVVIHRRDGPIATTTQIIVSAEDDAEIRQVSVTNLSPKPCEIEVTSYAEIALAPGAADAAHPAFSKLFVQTEFVPGPDALLATRRPREADEPRMWVAHLACVDGEAVGPIEYETDRARFLGRGRDARHAGSVGDGLPLSNTVGPVLDPVLCLRRRVRLAAGATARINFTTAAADSRQAALALADKYREPSFFERTATIAWTQAQVQLRHLGISPDEAHLFQRLATRILYSDTALRAPADVLARNRRGPSALWPHGISGDEPIVLVRIDHAEDQEIVHQLLRAHEYWRLKGLAADLVILNEEGATYGSDLRAGLESLVRTRRRAPGPSEGARGGVFILRRDMLSREDHDFLRSAARVVLLSRQGTLAEQVVRLLRAAPAATPPRPPTPRAPAAPLSPARRELEFFNGLGGFADEGREYVTILADGQWTPAPWINVIANPTFGFLASESGGGYTWAINSRLNQLTPWSNDPVTDPPGEALYVRDDETTEVWGPTALPARDGWPYVIAHGRGYTRFEHESRGIELTLTQFVPLEDPIKISRLTIENRSGRSRSLSVTGYARWLLGASDRPSAPFIVTEADAETGALFARNPWNEEFANRAAFADLGGRQQSWTADRTEFLGRNGGPEAPAALAGDAALSGRVGAGLDPCAALQTRIRLAPGERTEVLFLLGQAADPEEARRLVRRYREEDLDICLAAVRRRWDDTLTAVAVETPDRSMDILLNGWLLYQALSCRVFARAAFYQAGGAYGFRDQLQDVMALTAARPDIAREQILRAASRQFLEGDVQHWWHVPSGKGVRTRISDDLLWLPYAVTHFTDVTGDASILDEPVAFLDGEPLKPEEVQRYFEPKTASQTATLFEHCARALDRSLEVGVHGLPKMGAGDWNDGMNRVGHGGRGESVWLAWFLAANLPPFARLAEQRGESARAARWRSHADALKTALEASAWDGDWYRRAFFDDGTPLGSAANDECRIDSIAQSWAVLSGAADSGRSRRAMEAVDQQLVRRGDGLVLLLAPPFDRTPLDPGYIKGYLPGIRENGGQYTHGALWSVIAFAILGDGDRAAELFAMLNPVHHASTRAGLNRYKVEPYVVAADVYAEKPHVGRGGWTWYTGAAGWMYRASVEWILGLRVRGATLHLEPSIPRAWPRYRIDFRYRSARYVLKVENPHRVSHGLARVTLDGAPVATPIPLADDGGTHTIEAVLGGGP